MVDNMSIFTLERTPDVAEALSVIKTLGQGLVALAGDPHIQGVLHVALAQLLDVCVEGKTVVLQYNALEHSGLCSLQGSMEGSMGGGRRGMRHMKR